MDLDAVLNLDNWGEEKGYIDVSSPRCAQCGNRFFDTWPVAPVDVICPHCGTTQKLKIVNTPMGPAWATSVVVRTQHTNTE